MAAPRRDGLVKHIPVRDPDPPSCQGQLSRRIQVRIVVASQIRWPRPGLGKKFPHLAPARGPPGDLGVHGVPIKDDLVRPMEQGPERREVAQPTPRVAVM